MLVSVGDGWLYVIIFYEGCEMSFRDFDVCVPKPEVRQHALGMGFFGFVAERIQEHMILWAGVLIAVVAVASSVYSLCGSGDLFVRIVVIPFFWLIIALFCLFFCWLIVPALCLLAFVTVCIEAIWRIRENQPFVESSHRSLRFDDFCESTPRSGGSDWVFPLLAGLFIGHMWGGGD